MSRFFDSVRWDLALKAVERHTDQKWVMLYVERWLKAPMRMPDGTLTERTKGTPQGGPISPLLANLFLEHYSSVPRTWRRVDVGDLSDAVLCR